ncbi:MAG TPA: NAD(P)H-hydrate dehydratase [Gemmatimonadaceae bacterium]|nr:NAD(P)H-hydrate dehydratase [Gemmatimonadaceae bacterium]
MPPSVRVVSATESAERDRAAIEKGTPSSVLMQRAGASAAEDISRRYGDRLSDGVRIFTGPGNNGGDGWIVAGALARTGIQVTVVETAEPRSADAIAAKGAAVALVNKTVLSPSDRAEGNARAGIVIDALLGTGAQGEPRGGIATAIDEINHLRSDGARVASLDVPSGLDATSGRHGACVIADSTFTFGGVKRGSLIARDCCGEIVVLDIGLDDIEQSQPTAGPSKIPWLVDGAWVHAHIPPIRFDAHKGTRKHLAIIGGGPGMPGAAVLATRAALRSGIGLVRTLVSKESISAIVGAAPSALISEWPTDKSAISEEISTWANAIVIGPGLGKSAMTRKLVEDVIAGSDLPVLLDADALNVFDGDVDALGRLLRHRSALITPHVAEFSRLAGVPVQKVLDERFDIGLAMAQTLGATVLLKGAPTVIFTPDGERYVSARGTAALGTGGSGDLLSGIAGALLAQIGDAGVAACCAAWVHGRAAELCEYVRGTTLEDVLYALPRAWNENEPPTKPPVLAELPAVAL